MQQYFLPDMKNELGGRDFFTLMTLCEVCNNSNKGDKEKQ